MRGRQPGLEHSERKSGFGIEGDISYLGLRSSITFTNAVGTGSLENKYGWYASLRARAGMTVNGDATMVYVTGGLALSGLKMSGADPLTPVTTTNGKTQPLFWD